MTLKLEETDFDQETDAQLLALIDLEHGELHEEEIWQQKAQEEALAKARQKTIEEQEVLLAHLEDLPDQRIPNTTQQEKYAIERKHRDTLKKLTEEAAKSVEQQYLRVHPEAAHLACITKTTVRRAKPKRKGVLKRYIEQVIGCILWQSDKYPTMTSILDFVNREFRDDPQSANLWSYELPRFQLKRIAVFIQGNRPDWNVKLTGCKTLRDCRQAILFAKAKLGGYVSIKTQIHVTGRKLYVGDKAYPITSGEGYAYKRVRVEVEGKRQWMRLDTFLALFGVTP